MEKHGVDQWLLKTLGQYRTLHAYDVATQPRALAWFSGTEIVCAGGDPQEDMHELQALHLPEKLFSMNELCDERDAEVGQGALTEDAIADVCCFGSWPNDNRRVYATTAVNDASVVRLWHGTPEDTVLDPLTTVTVQGKHTGPVRMLKPLPGWVALTFAASANTLETYECHYQAAMPQLDTGLAEVAVAGVCHPDSDASSILVCGADGNAAVIDVRTGKALSRFAVGEADSAGVGEPVGEILSVDVALGWPSQTALFLRDDGTVLGHDLRVPTKPLFQATVGRSLHSRFDRVRAAPRRSHYLSVSGPCVALFDTSAWSGDVSGASPQFVHEAHESVVTAHEWHPDTADLLVSCSVDGELHAWRPV